MMIIISSMSMCWWRKNIIMMLLSLELILLTLFFSFSNSTNILPSSPLFIMLVMMVSGSSMGLSMLVSLSCSHNSSNSIFINILTFVKNPHS